MVINDGSDLDGLQVVVSNEAMHFNGNMTTGTSVSIKGAITAGPKGNGVEIQVSAPSEHAISVVGQGGEDYPLQKKQHSMEFLRENLHIRSRSNVIGAMLRVRSAASRAIINHFHQEGFIQVHTPIITGADCEGAGEMFRIVTEPLSPQNEFFENKAYLTVSGQLQAEMFACSHSKVFTFGPTFRAENSNTTRHLAEFWMLEPEMTYCNIDDAMDTAEKCVRGVIKNVREECDGDIEFFNKRVDSTLIDRLKNTVEKDFSRITYTEAISILQKSKESFKFPVEWGCNLQSEHERYIAEQHCKGPVFITDYPAGIKAFYMKRNDDGKTVGAYDLVVPRLGELVGGSVREDRYPVLKDIMIKHGLLTPEACEEEVLPSKGGTNMRWYLDLRKYGSVPHAGWGLGFERLLLYTTGLENIRDVIPVPRSPGQCKF